MSIATLRATCLINSYNYRDYVVEAVRSALQQSRPFDQILVIDDGSTDGSQDLLREQFGVEPRIEIVCKDNGGQLSCFNHAVSLIDGDLLFFLDADDRYRPDYLASALQYYQQKPVDFLIAGIENFGPNSSPARQDEHERDLGFSVLSSLLEKSWVGAPTSGLSMRTSLARRILPYPFEEAWRTKADVVLVYAASILGAHKYSLGRVFVDRRVHEANLYYNVRFDAPTSMRHSLALNRILEWYVQEAGYHVADLTNLLPVEFRTQSRPTFKEYRRYVRMSRRSPLRTVTRAKQIFLHSLHMWRTRFSRPAAVQPASRDIALQQQAA
jgi:glycosyltransferase involved in cell wall biosynthesis